MWRNCTRHAREEESIFAEHNVNAFSLFGSEDSLMETMALRAFAFGEAL